MNIFFAFSEKCREILKKFIIIEREKWHEICCEEVLENAKIGNVEKLIFILNNVGRFLQGAGCVVFGAECIISSAECRVSSAECRVSRAECRVQCRVQSLQCRVQSLKCRVQSLYWKLSGKS